jgi:hypothetical protein
MPRKFELYSPDWIDVNTQLTAIGSDFNARVLFTITVERDFVNCFARCYSAALPESAAPVAQSVSRKPLKAPHDLAQTCFALAQDSWRQLDSGNGAIAEKPLARLWSGRPAVARRDKSK